MTLVEQRPDTAPAPVHVTVETGNRWSLRKTAVVGAVGVLAAVGAYDVVRDYIPGLPDFDISNPFSNVGNHPPKVNASVMESTAEVEDEFKVHCEGRVGVGVINHGNKDELMGGGELDKIIFSDFLPCGDAIPVSVHKYLDPKTGEVKKIVASTNGLEVKQPRVDATDFRNCVALRPGDSQKDVDRKIRDYKKERKENPEDTECDNGFSISGAWVVGGDASKLINTANTATQIAIATWIAPKEIMGPMNDRFRKELTTSLEGRYPGAKVVVKLTSKKERVMAQTEAVLDDLKQNTYEVKKGEDEHNNPALFVTGPGGAEIRVTIDRHVARAYDEVKITSIESEVGEQKSTKTDAKSK